jgi:hypothetical protein
VKQISGWPIILLLVAGFIAIAIRLMGLQFAGGDVYPEYSSMRTDPRGSRLLYDSLARTPGVTVARNFLPIPVFPEKNTTLVLLGLAPVLLADPDHLKSFERTAGRGNRLVLALRSAEKLENAQELEVAWHVRLAIDPDPKHVHRLYFRESPGWQVWDRVDTKILGIERAFGQGQIVLLSGSDDFTNDSTVVMDRLTTVTTALGANPRVVFDESHLGIEESGSVVGLARRFRLTGLAFGLALSGALLIWRNAGSFPPATPAYATGQYAGRTSRSGLVTLLHRHIPADKVAAACWKEWLTANRRTASPHRLEQASAIAERASNEPLETIRELHSILSPPKGAS